MEDNMSEQDVMTTLTEMKVGFQSRKFCAGLLIALIDMMRSLGSPIEGVRDLKSFLIRFPRYETTARGGRANTLIVDANGERVGLRPFYNAIERDFRSKEKLFDFPSCAPHATQAWQDYTHWIDRILKMSPGELTQLRKAAYAHVLNELPSHDFVPGSIATDPPLFGILLDEFDMTARAGEKSGAAFQGVAFGFIRADNPHLQVEVSKVRTGSKRLQGVGDIDAWDGQRLAVTAEVKQFVVDTNTVHELEPFLGEGGKRGAITVIVALGFDASAVQMTEERGGFALALDDMRRMVRLWDPQKQRTAVSSLEYYVNHIEKNNSLGDRLREFLANARAAWEKQFNGLEAEE
jgi:hypothetical protein